VVHQPRHVALKTEHTSRAVTASGVEPGCMLPSQLSNAWLAGCMLLAVRQHATGVHCGWSAMPQDACGVPRSAVQLERLYVRHLAAQPPASTELLQKCVRCHTEVGCRGHGRDVRGKCRVDRTVGRCSRKTSRS
jgi:hypothetical protein